MSYETGSSNRNAQLMRGLYFTVAFFLLQVSINSQGELKAFICSWAYTFSFTLNLVTVFILE